MYESDYLVQLLMQFMAAIRRSIEKAGDQHDPLGAAEMLEAALGAATDMDSGLLLSLAPESMAGLLSVSGTDPQVVGYMVRSLLLASHYRSQAGDQFTSDLRKSQAEALGREYGLELDPKDGTEEAVEKYLDCHTSS